MNLWEGLRGPGSLESIEEEAFSKASKEAAKIPYAKSEVYTARRREIKRVVTVHNVLTKHLKRCYQIGRAFFKAHKFYRELISLYYPEERIVENTRRVRGLIRLLDDLKREYVHRINLLDDPEALARVRKEALGNLHV